LKTIGYVLKTRRYVLKTRGYVFLHLLGLTVAERKQHIVPRIEQQASRECTATLELDVPPLLLQERQFL
jgi:hypothetical protein